MDAPAPSRLLAGYRPLPGVPDELVDAAGQPRPGWETLLRHLDRRGAGFRRDVARGESHLADSGVFFRPYGDGEAAARDWPFRPVPIVLAQQEWDGLVAGLRQRADLLEAVVADLYGANRLVGEGHLPARLVAESPEWLRPLVGVVPRGGRFLHFVAFEVGRGPDGRWWVLSDRADAPSGAGFALETRVAATRVFPDLHREMGVHRLAGFFRDWRDALDSLRGPTGRVGILTPGALTDTYWEQAYIARYLGLPLLEGGDLVVEGGRLALRTVAGPEEMGVLWRRMDGVWADPLELADRSRLGTPGLVQAVRQGRLTLVNALGAGVLETQALMAFLPAIARRVLGGPLLLPNVATWWCGGRDEREHVRAAAHRMTIFPALATRMPFETGEPHAVAGEMRGADRDLDDWLEEEGAGLVGKELVTLSTTPVWQDGRLVPRPMSIRVFLARAGDGWIAMPGGFGRVGGRADPAAIALREGGGAADVWVVAQGAPEAATLLPARGAPARAALPGPLPSRAADSLFWLGRYVERTEGLLRLSRAFHARRAEGAGKALTGLLARRLDACGVEASQAVPEGILATLDAARRNAGAVRDRFSVDGWAALGDLRKSMARMGATARPGADAALALSALLRKVAGFAGLVHENMYRGPGWRFLSLGRSLERAAMTAESLALLAAPGTPEGALDCLIEVGDSVMTHRQRYALVATRDSVLDLLALDEANPRAVRFHLGEVADHLAALSGREAGPLAGAARRSVELEGGLGLETPGSLTPARLRALRDGLWGLSDLVGEAALR